MKKAAVVFVWIGIIFNCILIFPIFVGIYALDKLNNGFDIREKNKIAIITMFFCNIVAGFCILGIKDNEIATNTDIKTSNENKILVYRDEESIKKSEEERKKREIEFEDRCDIISFIFKVQLACLIAVFVLSIMANIDEFGTPVPLIFAIFTAVMFAINSIIFLKNGELFDDSNKMFSIIFIIINIVSAIISLIYNFELGHSFELWFIVFLSFGLILSTFYMLHLYNDAKENLDSCDCSVVKEYLIEKFDTISKKTESKVVSKMELELSEAKRLYENESITKTEYEKIRESIIKKYYN